ncbi:MAG: methyltransferase domain-containing protein [Candidatus Cloacimonetes bacterium]|nr:methyltransferase domain-containing protein [Candidatus Cloacimonadota bacterium]
MKTNYSAHDKVYKHHKEEKLPGWDSSEKDYIEFKVHLEKIIARGLAPRVGKFLELGCGAGNIAIWLAKKGYETYGVDIAPTAIAWAQEKAQKQNVVAHFSTGNVLDLSTYSNAFFDFVLDGHCLHCIIGEDRQKMFSSVRRVLKQGGYFLINTMCGPVNPEKVKNFDPISGYTIFKGIATRYYGLPDSILAEIEKAGFSIMHWEVEHGDPNATLTVEAVNHES